MFRKLKADEIDCRIASCNAYGVQLLLYKNARVDQTILDETVGPMNWQENRKWVSNFCGTVIHRQS